MTFNESLNLWVDRTPRKSWLKLELGDDGWVVQVLTHGEHRKDIKIIFDADDYVYGFQNLPAALEEAHRVAVAEECWVK